MERIRLAEPTTRQVAYHCRADVERCAVGFFRPFGCFEFENGQVINGHQRFRTDWVFKFAGETLCIDPRKQKQSQSNEVNLLTVYVSIRRGVTSTRPGRCCVILHDVPWYFARVSVDFLRLMAKSVRC